MSNYFFLILNKLKQVIKFKRLSEKVQQIEFREEQKLLTVLGDVSVQDGLCMQKYNFLNDLLANFNAYFNKGEIQLAALYIPDNSKVINQLIQIRYQNKLQPQKKIQRCKINVLRNYGRRIGKILMGDKRKMTKIWSRFINFKYYHDQWINQYQYTQGYNITLIRQLIGCTSLFLIYQIILRKFIPKNCSYKDSLFYAPLIAGALSGLAYWIYVYPVDFIQTLIQFDSLTQQKYMNCFKKIIKKQGFKAIENGFLVVIIGTPLVNSVGFLVFQLSMRLVGKESDHQIIAYIQ